MPENTDLSKLLEQLTRIADALDVISNSPQYRAPKPDIYRIGLLTTKEYNDYYSRIPHYGAHWWLDAQERSPKEAPMVTRDGKVEKIGTDISWAMIRPALYVANGSEFAYKQCVKVGKYYFTYIGGECLLCNVCIKAISYKDIQKMAVWEWTNLVFGLWDWMLDTERKASSLEIPKKPKVTLLSAEEYRKLRENIPIFEDPWWLRTDEPQDTHDFIRDGDTVSSVPPEREITMKIRPAIIIPNNKLNLKPKDSVRVGKLLFTYIGDNYLLCDTSVSDYTPPAKERTAWEQTELCGKVSDMLLSALEVKRT